MFEFFKTMENFENSVNPEVKTDNSPEACVSPDEPNYIELRSAALNNFDCQFNELIDNYDETLNNNDERRMRKDENLIRKVSLQCMTTRLLPHSDLPR